MTRNCALCGISFEPTELSHIVPAFAYRWLKATSATGFIRYGRRMNRRDQDGIKDYFLCRTCEDCFASCEGVFAKQIFYPFVENNACSIEYGEDFLRFGVSVSWRVLAYARENDRLRHFRGRHENAIARALETWRRYLLNRSDGIGRHEIHVLPFCGVVDCTSPATPPNINRYLRRAIEIDTVVSDNQAVTYCKLGPLIFIGLIEYPARSHWQNTKIHKTGRLEPRETTCPIEYQNYIFGRSRRVHDLETSLSEQQLQKIKAAYVKNAERIADSDTYAAAVLDRELQAKLKQRTPSV